MTNLMPYQTAAPSAFAGKMQAEGVDPDDAQIPDDQDGDLAGDEEEIDEEDDETVEPDARKAN